MQLPILLLTILALASKAGCHYTADSNSLHDVIHFIHGQFSTTIQLTQAEIRSLYSEVLEKAECEEKSTRCDECLDALLAVFVPHAVDTLEKWNKASAAMLYGVLNTAVFCNMTAGEMAALNTTTALLGFMGTDTASGVGEEEIEHLLETLTDGFSGEEHHDEEEEATAPPMTSSNVTTSANMTTTTGRLEEDGHDEEEEDDHEGHDHEEAVKCFGEGTLLYYLGLDHEESLEAARVPEMSGILISYLVQDWVVDEACQVLPKQSHLLDDLFELFGEGTGAITEEGFEMLLEQLGIASVAGAPTVESSSVHNHKRSISTLTRTKRSEEEEESITSQCLGEGTLAAIYDFHVEDGINREQFLQMCPALIQQQVSGSCAAPETTSTPTEEKRVTAAETYGYGTLAVVVISLLALIGALLIPCINSLIVKYFLSMFVALGVGTLLGDALLHLMPQALGLHDHGAEEEGEEHAGGVSETVLLQLITSLAIYLFWLFESLMGYLRPKSSVAQSPHGHSHGMTVTDLEETDDRKVSTPTKGTGAESSLSGSSDSSADEPKKPQKGIPTVALMILIGDGLHNFIDGIALGAAFSTSLQDGLGTSIAVFCHELPHELGDFSMLLNVGVSKVKAILFNLLSASMCLLGMFVGAAAAAANEDVRKWLLALTAGMFIYVALVDMMPELMTAGKEGKWWIHFLMQNIGMVLGLMLMLTIAALEEQIMHLE